MLEREEAAWASVPYLYSERTRRRHADRIAEDIARRLPFASGPVTHTQQLAAAASHRAVDRLGDIRAPTLVVHGDEDAVVPVENARLLAAGIPGAELRIWPRAAHLYATDEPRADREVAGFLWRHTPERSSPRARLGRALAAGRRLLRGA
jgi:alpha-beta hydrolase superfamily lysophospholipase